MKQQVILKPKRLIDKRVSWVYEKYSEAILLGFCKDGGIMLITKKAGAKDFNKTRTHWSSNFWYIE